MQQDIIQEYFQLRKQSFEIDARLEELKPAVIAALKQANGYVNLDGYNLALRSYTAWDYSARVKEMQQHLNDTKQQEREQGIAQITEKRLTLVLTSHRTTGSIAEQNTAYIEWEEDGIV